MVELKRLEHLELDALREVANIGAGHAATALSQMIRRRIMLSVPRLEISRLEDVPDAFSPPDQIVAAVLMHVLGDLSGRTLLILPQASAERLAVAVQGKGEGASGPLGDMERSALNEVGNIVTSAYMNALSDFLGLMLLPSVPSLRVDLVQAVLTTACTDFGHRHDHVFCVDTLFTLDEIGEPINGHFVLLPDAESLDVILRAVRAL